jgi:hypothetical protein
VAQRVGRGIALLFTTAALEGSERHAPAALYPRERPCTHFTEGWVGPKAGLDGRKISSPPGFFLIATLLIVQYTNTMEDISVTYCKRTVVLLFELYCSFVTLGP